MSNQINLRKMRLKTTESNENFIEGLIVEKDLEIGTFELIHKDYKLLKATYKIGNKTYCKCSNDNEPIVELLDRKADGLLRNLDDKVNGNYEVEIRAITCGRKQIFHGRVNGYPFDYIDNPEGGDLIIVDSLGKPQPPKVQKEMAFYKKSVENALNEMSIDEVEALPTY